MPIGVFDSGHGGLTVLRALLAGFPDRRFIYLGDHRMAPYGAQPAGRIVDRCVQIFGSLGVSNELPLERWYRELRIKRIGEGPSEVHRMVIARDLLRNQSGRN